MIKSLLKRLLGRESKPAPSPKAYPFKYDESRAPSPAPSATSQPAEPKVSAEPVDEAPVDGAPVDGAPVDNAPVASQVEGAAEEVAQGAAKTAEDSPEREPTPSPDYSAWTVKQLRAELTERGVELKSKVRKAELVEMLAPPEPEGLSEVVVQELLDDMVRPALQADGGDITLIKVQGMDVHVRLVGACSTCPSSIMTMKLGVEALFREEFPGFGELIEVP